MANPDRASTTHRLFEGRQLAHLLEGGARSARGGGARPEHVPRSILSSSKGPNPRTAARGALPARSSLWSRRSKVGDVTPQPSRRARRRVAPSSRRSEAASQGRHQTDAGDPIPRALEWGFGADSRERRPRLRHSLPGGPDPCDRYPRSAMLSSVWSAAAAPSGILIVTADHRHLRHHAISPDQFPAFPAASVQTTPPMTGNAAILSNRDQSPPRAHRQDRPGRTGESFRSGQSRVREGV